MRDELEEYKEWEEVEENDDELTNWRKQLKNGNFFIKHHKWGKPKLRLVWCDEIFSEIRWGDPKETKDSDKIKGRILVGDIKEIRPLLIKSKKPEMERQECSFSIITKKRTLELETPTSEARDKWVEIFRKLKDGVD